MRMTKLRVASVVLARNSMKKRISDRVHVFAFVVEICALLNAIVVVVVAIVVVHRRNRMFRAPLSSKDSRIFQRMLLTCWARLQRRISLFSPRKMTTAGRSFWRLFSITRASIWSNWRTSGNSTSGIPTTFGCSDRTCVINRSASSRWKPAIERCACIRNVATRRRATISN